MECGERAVGADRDECEGVDKSQLLDEESEREASAPRASVSEGTDAEEPSSAISLRCPRELARPRARRPTGRSRRENSRTVSTSNRCEAGQVGVKGS